jgi:hypothetical protein
MLFTPALELCVRLPMGGGAMLNALFVAGLGGGMLNDEYALLCAGLGGGVIPKFDVLDVPQLLDVSVEDVDALLQSIPPAELCAPYDGVGVGAIMLCIPTPDLPCCSGGGANVGLPIPGLLGAIAGNEELSALSGVMARLCALGTLSAVLDGGGGDTGGVDQEKVAAGDALLVDRERGWEGKVVADEADAEAFAHGSPPSMSEPPDGPCWPPRTRAAKSASPPASTVPKPLAVLEPPKLMNSLRVVAVALFAPSSWSLRVCSFSTRMDMDLIRVM